MLSTTMHTVAALLLSSNLASAAPTNQYNTALVGGADPKYPVPNGRPSGATSVTCDWPPTATCGATKDEFCFKDACCTELDTNTLGCKAGDKDDCRFCNVTGYFGCPVGDKKPQTCPIITKTEWKINGAVVYDTISSDKMTWFEAVEYCHQKGKVLAEPRVEDATAALLAAGADLPIADTVEGHIWIGAVGGHYNEWFMYGTTPVPDVDQVQKWQWHSDIRYPYPAEDTSFWSGHAVSNCKTANKDPCAGVAGEANPKGAYVNWGNGEPNNYQEAEDCAIMANNNIYDVQKGQWLDIKCSLENYAVCADRPDYFIR